MFPLWLKGMKGYQPVRMVRENVVKKISTVNHASVQKTKEAILPLFQALFRNDTRFACKMIKTLNLSDSETKYLLGEKYLHKMKEIVACAQKADDRQEEIEITEVLPKKNEEEKKESSDLKQPSIFDF